MTSTTIRHSSGGNSNSSSPPPAAGDRRRSLSLRRIGGRQRDTDQCFLLRSDYTVVGRNAGCDIVVATTLASRKHCTFFVSPDDGSVSLTDDSSSNGTFVNQKRLAGTQRLAVGDLIGIGCSLVDPVELGRSLDTLVLKLQPLDHTDPGLICLDDSSSSSASSCDSDSDCVEIVEPASQPPTATICLDDAEDDGDPPSDAESMRNWYSSDEAYGKIEDVNVLLVQLERHPELHKVKTEVKAEPAGESLSSLAARQQQTIQSDVAAVGSVVNDDDEDSNDDSDSNRTVLNWSILNDVDSIIRRDLNENETVAPASTPLELPMPTAVVEPSQPSPKMRRLSVKLLRLSDEFISHATRDNGIRRSPSSDTEPLINLVRKQAATTETTKLVDGEAKQQREQKCGDSSLDDSERRTSLKNGAPDKANGGQSSRRRSHNVSDKQRSEHHQRKAKRSRSINKDDLSRNEAITSPIAGQPENNIHPSSSATNSDTVVDEPHVPQPASTSATASLPPKQPTTTAAPVAHAAPAKTHTKPKVKMTLSNRGAFLADMASLPPKPADLKRQQLAAQIKAATPLHPVAATRLQQQQLQPPSRGPSPLIDLNPQHLLKLNSLTEATIYEFLADLKHTGDGGGGGPTLPYGLAVDQVKERLSAGRSQAASSSTGVDALVLESMMRSSERPLDDVLDDVTAWDADWLDSATAAADGGGAVLAGSAALLTPSVNGDDWQPLHMLSNYIDYREYEKIMLPILKLELWQSINNAYRNPTPSPSSSLAPHIGDQQPPRNRLYTNIIVSSAERRFERNRLSFTIRCSMVTSDYGSSAATVDGGRRGHLMLVTFPNEAGVVYNVLAVVTQWQVIASSISYGQPTIHFELKTHNLMGGFLTRRTASVQATVVCTLHREMAALNAMRGLRTAPLLTELLRPAEFFYDEPPAAADNDADGLCETIRTLLQQLNAEQSRVLRHACHRFRCSRRSPNITLIDGPPGTGKSQLVAALLLRLVYGADSAEAVRGSRPPKIVYCARFDATLDAVCQRLVAVEAAMRRDGSTARPFSLVRIGHPDRVHPACQPLLLDAIAARATAATIEDEKAFLMLKLATLRLSASATDATQSYYRRRQRLLERCTKEIGQSSSSPSSSASINAAYRRYQLASADIVCIGLLEDADAQLDGLTGATADDDDGVVVDLCIVDDAAGLTEPETLALPLRCGGGGGVRALLLVGDSQQRPVAAAGMCPAARRLGLDRSLFDRLQNVYECSARPASPAHRLAQQYRMDSDIASWPNRVFYDRRLRCAADNAPLARAKETCPLWPYAVLDVQAAEPTKAAARRRDPRAAAAVAAGAVRTEVDMVVVLLAGILPRLAQASGGGGDGRVETWTVGVIVPDSAYRIHLYLKLKDLQMAATEQVVVRTLDAFRGQQMDVVIVCSAHAAHIAADPAQRLSLALTRARLCLIVCGQFEELRDCELFRSMLKNAKKRDCYRTIDLGEREERRLRSRLLRHVLKS